MALGLGLDPAGAPQNARLAGGRPGVTALNRPNEVRLHLRGALNNGVSREGIQEVLSQTTVYCGVPAALESFRIVAEVLEEEDAKKR